MKRAALVPLLLAAMLGAPAGTAAQGTIATDREALEVYAVSGESRTGNNCNRGVLMRVSDRN